MYKKYSLAGWTENTHMGILSSAASLLANSERILRKERFGDGVERSIVSPSCNTKLNRIPVRCNEIMASLFFSTLVPKSVANFFANSYERKIVLLNNW